MADAPTTRGDQGDDFIVGEPFQFIGRVRRRAISEVLGTTQTRVRHVSFDAGTRSRPHTHSHDQLLYYVKPGLIAIDGGDDQLIDAGEYVLLPGGVPHMHGARNDQASEHISIMDEIDSDFECPIPEQWRRFRDR
jgi:quercetin dioxygenase-like cupin family protein